MQDALNLNLTAHEGPEAMEEASVMVVGLNPPLLRDGIALPLLVRIPEGYAVPLGFTTKA